MSDKSAVYRQWWCDGTLAGAGLANVYDMPLLQRIDTPLQTIELYEHAIAGWVLVLDGVIKTARYQPVRREMMTHVPLLGRSHDDDDGTLEVLIAGGGSGELLQEVLQHARVGKVVVVDSDEQLIGLAKNQLGFAAAFADARVETVIAPLEDFTAQARRRYQHYDVIITDLYDSTGRLRKALTEQQFTAEFYDDFAALLDADSVVVDARAVLLDKAHEVFSPQAADTPLRLADVLAARGQFHHIERYHAPDPLLPGGMTLFSLYCKNEYSYSEPTYSYQGNHYHEVLHKAAFALPTWLQKYQRAGHLHSADKTAPLWFEQTSGSGISQAMPMQRIYHEQSAFQEIEYYQHEHFGCVFVLDGTVQGSHADECIYHEMAVHVPVLGRRRDSIAALVIGGGDGGIVRELLKHDHVRRIVMAEIDERVIATSNHYFGVQGDYADPKVELHIGDAADYVARAAVAGDHFELIIVDATDSTEPSANLWNDTFFANLARCLSDDGVCLDSDILIAGKRNMLSRDLHGEGLRDIKRARQFFAGVEGYYTKIPLFPGGYFALFLYTRDGFSYARPYREFTGIHYNAELHRAAFVLPAWWQKLLSISSS
jgi:spermidine synthase